MTDRLTSRRPRSLTTLLISLCCATALLVGGIFTVLLVSIIDQRTANSSAASAADQLSQAFAIERSAVDLETGVRGYLLTQDRAFLSPYYQARSRLPGQLSLLMGLARTASERSQIEGIKRSVAGYIDSYAAPLVATRGRLSHAKAVSVTAMGKRRLDTLRAQLSALSATDPRLRDRSRAAANSASDRAIIVGSLGLALSVALLLGLSLYIVRRLLLPTRAVAAAAERLAAGQLAVRVPEVGFGETALLGRSFNAMAEKLQSRDYELSMAQERLERALHEAREMSTMKSNFVANMSHEIRTPLNGVVGMLELLGETGLTSEQREFASVARASADALMSVVNDVLDVAKIEAGRLELEQRDFDLHELVESACDMVAATAATRGVELQSFVHEDVPRIVCGDRMRVGQILANLMSNAVKFTPEGEVVLEVMVVGHEGERYDIRFEVRDTGIGIAPERVAQLFEPFTQADAGTTRLYGGTGLGLTIVRELSRLMQAKIDVESDPGRGSTFGVTIPLVATGPHTRGRQADELRGLRVLIVDDNATNRRIFEAYTAAWGMRPSQASRASSALARLEQASKRGEAFDVALVDFHMPERNGVELAHEMRSNPLLATTRVIVLSSSGQVVPDDPANGIDYSLSKPVRQSRLLDAISMVMAREPTQAIGRPEPIAPREPTRSLAPGTPGLQPTGPQQPSGPQQPTGPLAEPTTPAADNGAGTPAQAPPVQGFSILVAEDQPVNWLLAERMLAKRGHRVDHALNGELALQMLETGDYDLVFMDCQMPVLDGYEATRRMRQREQTAGRSHLPVIAMTAHAMAGDREKCLAAGMDDYVAKPITTGAIDAILDRWLPDPNGDPASGLDVPRLEELRQLFSGEEFAQMLKDLEDDVDSQLLLIAQARSDGDCEGIAEAAHRVLNDARMLGAESFVQAATAVESAADDAERVAEAEADLRRCWAGVRDMVRAFAADAVPPA